MKTRKKNTEKKNWGWTLRRSVAMLLVLIECFSLMAVGFPASYADSGSVPLSTDTQLDGARPDGELSDQEEDKTGETSEEPEYVTAVEAAETAEAAAEEAEAAAQEAEEALLTAEEAEALEDAAAAAEQARAAAERADLALERAQLAADFAAQEADRTAWAAEDATLEAEQAAAALERMYGEAAETIEASADPDQERKAESSERPERKAEDTIDGWNRNEPEENDWLLTALEEAIAEAARTKDAEEYALAAASEAAEAYERAVIAADAATAAAERAKAAADSATEIEAAKTAEAEQNIDGDDTKGDETDGDETKGDETKGDETKGDETDGDETKGDETKGDETKGDETDGDETKDDETKDDEKTTDDSSTEKKEEAPAETLIYSDSAVSLSGEAPAELVVETEDVSAHYADFDPNAFLTRSLLKTTLFMNRRAPSRRSVETKYSVLAAYDISLSVEGEKYQPDADSPLTVSISDPAINKDLTLQVWHIHDDGTGEQIYDFTVEGDSVTFAADSFSAYLVVQVTVTTYITAGDGNTYRVSVTYDQDAEMPENTDLAVRELGDDEKEDYVNQSAEALGTDAEDFAFARAFDISLLDPDTGLEVQPASGVRVSVSLLDINLNSIEELKLLHFGEEVETVGYTLNEDAIEFETDGFSVYVITGENPVPRRIYTFYYLPEAVDYLKPDIGEYIAYPFKDDKGNIVFSQIVKNGSELIVPQLSSVETAIFAGWYKNTVIPGFVLDSEPYDFDNIEITENDAIDLYAVYKSFATVIFHDQYGSSSGTFPVVNTRKGELVEGTTSDPITGNPVTVPMTKVQINDVTTTYTSSSETQMAFYGWSYKPIRTPGSATDDEGYPVDPIEPDQDGCITILEDTHLYPIYKQIHRLSFYSGPTGSGASYIPSTALFVDDGLTTLSDRIPERSGYTFMGWYAGTMTQDPDTGDDVISWGQQITNADGSLIQPVDDGGVYYSESELKLRNDATLFAKWDNAQQIPYKVIIWKQKATAAADTPTQYKYELVESHLETAAPNSQVSVANEYRNLPALIGAGFFCAEFSPETPINNSGYTVLHVWYDKGESYTPPTGQKHTLIFKDSYNTERDAFATYSIDAGTALSDYVPADPEHEVKGYSGQKVFSFTAWFADPLCSTQVFFSKKAMDDYTGYNQKVLYDTMPDEDLTIYAGWEADWYIVQIDPNYGTFEGTGGTWFWETYDGQLVQEYTQVRRDYVESSSGTYYYVKHNRAYYGYSGNEWDNSEPDRDAHYTTNINDATEDKTFEYAPGNYTYAGWYEVLPDGSEIPYDFSRKVDHDMYLKLHWKKNGIYYLAYDAGRGTMENGVDTTAMENAEYADFSEVEVARAALPPSGNSFIGWKVRGSDSDAIYTPGQVLTLQAENAVRIGGRDVVYLDAVYVPLGTASIIYDANGGVIDKEVANLGYTIDSQSGETQANAEFDTGDDELTAHTATVSGLANNGKFRLSKGAGFRYEKEDVEFAGWSSKAVDPDVIFKPGEVYGVDREEPITLYAVWKTTLTYHLNNDTNDWLETDAASWGRNGENGIWSDPGDPENPYTYDSAANTHTQTVYLGSAAGEPPYIPKYTDTRENPTDERSRMFFQWRTVKYDVGAAPDTPEADADKYDFSEPVTGPLDLYAYWAGEISVPVHVLDASQERITEKTVGDGWTISNVRVGADPVSLPGNFVTAPSENYALAFVAIHEKTGSEEGLQSVSPDEAITGVYYNQRERQLYIKFADTTKADAPFYETHEIYYVFYEKKPLPIAYCQMQPSGVLNAVTTVPAAPVSTALLGEFDMAEAITSPMTWTNNGYAYYAYAVGIANAPDTTGLPEITATSTSDDSRPALFIRNTWRGFQFSEDGSIWIDYGYDPTLYVVYFQQLPTVITFDEQTVGPETLKTEDTKFYYDLLVTQAVTTTVTQATQKKDGDTWVDVEGTEIQGDTPTVENSILYSSGSDNYARYVLWDGASKSAPLFYSSTQDKTYGAEYEKDGNTYRSVTTTTVVTEQSMTLTQVADERFETSVAADGGNITQPYEWKYTSSAAGGTRNVTFTNTHKAFQVEVHVAMVEGEGLNGGIVRRDNLRSETETAYSFTIENGTSVELLNKLPAAGLFTGDLSVNAFGAIILAPDTANGEAITSISSMGVAKIAYERIDGNRCELVVKDAAGNTLGELGSNKLYYLYYPMPKIRFVKADSAGNLTQIQGCLPNAQTGEVELSAKYATYNYMVPNWNSGLTEQYRRFEIPMSGLVISQNNKNTRLPPILDDGTSEGFFERYLSYEMIGAGNGDVSHIDSLADKSDSLRMELRIQNNALQFNVGNGWKDLSLDGEPTIYFVYTERGYDLLIHKTVPLPAGEEDNPVFTRKSFAVTISSDALKNKEQYYDAEGAESMQVEADTLAGTISLTVTDGSKIKIKGLPRGEYTITESENDNYNLTAKTGPIVSSPTNPDRPAEVRDNKSVSVSLNGEVKLELTNSPKPLCRLKETENIFYTLRSAVAYVEEENITDADLEMLADYLMPTEDTVEIPKNFSVSLATADDGFVGAGKLAVITRSEELKNTRLFTNKGDLFFTTIILDGNEIDATQPFIRSEGNLTIGADATLKDVVNGGAVRAVAGDVTVSGIIENCSAPVGGAVYHSGNGSVAVNGEAKIQNNAATTGNGGAVYLTGGTVNVSGSAVLSKNKAEAGNGGAIYVGSAVIEVDKSAKFSENTAQSGGAIYAGSGTITVEKTEGYDTAPSFTGNTASTDGGAIWVGMGSVGVSGGSLSGNTAAGKGGAVFADNASVSVSGTAVLSSDKADKGGAVYAERGIVTLSGGSLSGNSASTDGGAVYAGIGNVTVSGGSMTQNNATAGSGGAIYADSGRVTVSGGSLSNNTANTDGGAVFAGSGSITVSVPDGGTAPTIQSNTAATGKGGALYANTGAISITGTALTKNKAGADGGAVYAGSGAVTFTNSVFGGAAAEDGNASGGSGGAVYAGSGNVTVSGGSMAENKATAGNGGAMYAGSGVVTVTDTAFTNNKANAGNKENAGKGGAISLNSGVLTLNTVSATGNGAVNGAAVFVESGRANFEDGSFTENTATEGGAVGVGSKNARLYFNGDVQVKDNTMGEAKSNVYLDQDDDAVINIDKLGTNAAIGIHVPDAVVDTRSVPGARFAVYTSNSNANIITNDRYTSLTVQSDTAAKKFYWGNGVRIEVMYRGSNSSGLPNGTSTGRGTTVKDIGTYYPTINSEGEVALSELAADVYTRYTDVSNGLKSHPNATFGSAFYYDAPQYSYDISMLVWNTTEEKWQVGMRNGQTEDLSTRRIYVIYSEPAYISIENNTEEQLIISDLKMTVNGSNISVINNSTSTGYGMVFAKNGAIRTALLPITASDLTLKAGQSVSLLIPGGQNMAYTLDGSFETTTGGSVRLRRGAEASLSEETVEVSATGGTFKQLTGTTLNAAGTYNIIFGDNKIICKVVDADGDEHPYSKISDAIADIVATAGANPPYTLTKAKTATIEMVTDYLLTASDDVKIPQGYDITLTTAAKEGATYCYNGSGDRATISRDTLNTDSMIKGWNALENNKVVTTLRLNNLIFDGKSVRGSSDGGAVATQYVNVYVDTVDFKNVYASNGGALLVMFNFDKRPDHTKDAQDTLPGTVLEVKHSDFIGCTSTTTVKSNRLGGGAIVTNAETMTLEDCDFTSCTAVDQAGAVFHRVDKNNNSWTNVTGCTFTNCSANAAGGLEIDSKTINVTNCRFEHCVAKERNGGGFNVYALNAATPTADCWVTVSDCTFNDCQLTTTNTSNGNGGGFRCNAVYTKVINSTFTNNLALYGGGFCISNGNAKKGEVYGCTFERNTANQGGGIFGKPYSLIIGDGYYYLDNSNQAVSVLFENGSYKDLSGNPITDDAILRSIQPRNTEIKNCTSQNEGGGIYHDKNADNTSLAITNATISGNQIKINGKNGGGVFTNCRTVTINGATITDNICTNKGGGLYAYSYKSLTITDSSISRNIASSDGGGVWFDADNDTNRAKQVLTVKGSTFDGNTSTGGSGGGIYTQAQTVAISASGTKNDENGKPVPTTISNCTSFGSGGGVHQYRPTDASSFTMSGSVVTTCKSTKSDANGGGVYTNALTATVEGSTFSHNTAPRDGGGLYNQHWVNNVAQNKTLSIRGCTFDDNTAGRNGGGVSACAKALTIGGLGEGENSIPSSFTECKANVSGGGVQHNNSTDGTTTTIRDCSFEDCHAYGTGDNGGGGVVSNSATATLTNVTMRGNTSGGNGGGILYTHVSKLTASAADTGLPDTGLTKTEANPANGGLTFDHCELVGNTAGNMGGGAYSKSFVKLRNDSMIHGNTLSVNNKDNAAGLYLENNMTLVVGTKGAEKDSSSICDNETSAGTASNLRLWWNSSNKENNAMSVYVNCPLTGQIRVLNAAKVGTVFGKSAGEDFDGFADDQPVFRADDSTLHGIYHRTLTPKNRIIWAGPPIARITGLDENGEEIYLYLKENGSDPAVFDRLDDGTDNYSKISAFSILRSAEPELYTKEGVRYSGNEYRVRMLVPAYTTEKRMKAVSYPDRKIVFTTAEKDDPYREEGNWTRSTVTRGTGVGNSSLLYANVNFELTNIVLDGNDKAVAANNTTRILDINNANATVTLGLDAILQNASMTGNGGGVYVNTGTFVIAGGIIRDCKANNGGGIYVANRGAKAALEAGNITRCTATANGGGVCINADTFTMSGGTISGGTANQGGGVYVNNSNFNMSGGTITNNSAVTKGGGVAFAGNSPKIWFGGTLKVNISGNTSEESLATNKACNVEMDKDSNAVINTHNGGLLPGSYVGVYVPGVRDDAHPENESGVYRDHGGKKDPFGTFVTGDNTATFYSFVNDRNGLKGGIIENPAPNTIYWVEIFALRVQKKVEYSPSMEYSSLNPQVNPYEQFGFTVNIWGTPSSGQPGPAMIDSEIGEFGEMFFKTDGTTASASFQLGNDESVMGVNLSEGLHYSVIENLTDEQKLRYAVLPTATFTRERGIGENKGRTDVDPYVSSVVITNILPICKITANDGRLLYRRYTVYQRDTNGEYLRDGNGNRIPLLDHQNNPVVYDVPAVYTELTGEDGAFRALEKDTFKLEGATASYSVANGVQIQMLIPNYSLTEPVVVPIIGNSREFTVTLTTASKTPVDEKFPYQGIGTTSTIVRRFDGDSMFIVQGDGTMNLTADNVILDGAKQDYTASENGGIVRVEDHGKLTVTNNATLQNSRSTKNGGAVYVKNGGTVTMRDNNGVGGRIQKNESVGYGAGIYLENGGRLNLSGNPYLGGKGTNAAEAIIQGDGNYCTSIELPHDAKNGGKTYTRARQDIYLADDNEKQPAVIHITGNLSGVNGSIWVWPEKEYHYKQLMPFAKLDDGVSGGNLMVFRDARPDAQTENSTSTYLYGTPEGETAGYVYWSGLKGSRTVILRKVVGSEAQAGSLAGMSFTVYRQGESKPYDVKHEIKGAADVLTETLENLTSGANGVFWVGELPFGEYDIEEVGVGWFLLIVGDKDRNGHDLPDGYWISPRGDARPQ